MESKPQEDPKRDTELDKRTLLLIEHMKGSAGESDRGHVLFLAAQMDSYLREVLQSFLVEHKSASELFEGPYAPFGSLSAKTKAAFLLGLITHEEAACVDAVRKVRNIFAHEMEASFEHPDVKKLCAKPPILDTRTNMNDRDAFLHMGMNAAIPLLYRVLSVKKKWRRKELTPEAASKR